MRRAWGIRHLRYFIYRLRVERQAMRYFLRGEGLRPGPQQCAALGRIWRGEA